MSLLFREESLNALRIDNFDNASPRPIWGSKRVSVATLNRSRATWLLLAEVLNQWISYDSLKRRIAGFHLYTFQLPADIGLVPQQRPPSLKWKSSCFGTYGLLLSTHVIHILKGQDQVTVFTDTFLYPIISKRSDFQIWLISFQMGWNHHLLKTSKQSLNSQTLGSCTDSAKIVPPVTRSACYASLENYEKALEVHGKFPETNSNFVPESSWPSPKFGIICIPTPSIFRCYVMLVSGTVVIGALVFYWHMDCVYFGYP